MLVDDGPGYVERPACTDLEKGSLESPFTLGSCEVLFFRRSRYTTLLMFRTSIPQSARPKRNKFFYLVEIETKSINFRSAMIITLSVALASSLIIFCKFL